ncbi:twin-arginine translocation signal domain-containing protein [Halarcobacter ebronensis]|uniref:Tat pathway signal protein n=1 Tax=Halarcobacter ebronensis TaxID=1462615 RepID=A0A4V1M0B6_9BACT|nr:twin-arginine translocation signal domain-containing protein [Halarcobacter ebronensis]QKF81796.1 putative formate dehydrogenase-associated protein [Halarcobacter ebronensis]RXK04532.1 Tat pathway signal protein [Halarcobacter ebronensis]
MKNQRRSFIKALGTSAAVAAVGVTASLASNENKTKSTNGVVVGKSPKKEILYKETAQWDAFYKASY